MATKPLVTVREIDDLKDARNEVKDLSPLFAL